MSSTGTLTRHAASEKQTACIAQTLSRFITPGDVILLSGDVGAGKSHFARALIREALTEPEEIPSPTFTLVQTYPTRQGEIWHSDLYRLSDITEIEELGLLEAFTNAICLVEWPDRLGGLLPENALNITFSAGDDPDTRQLTFTWSDPRWDKTMAEVQNV